MANQPSQGPGGQSENIPGFRGQGYTAPREPVQEERPGLTQPGIHVGAHQSAPAAPGGYLSAPAAQQASPQPGRAQQAGQGSQRAALPYDEPQEGLFDMARPVIGYIVSKGKPFALAFIKDLLAEYLVSGGIAALAAQGQTSPSGRPSQVFGQQITPEVQRGLGEVASFVWPYVQHVVSKGTPYLIAFIRELLDEVEKTPDGDV
jgi:hypothetical protein